MLRKLNLMEVIMNTLKKLMSVGLSLAVMATSAVAVIVPVRDKNGRINHFQDNVTGARSSKAAYNAQQAALANNPAAAADQVQPEAEDAAPEPSAANQLSPVRPSSVTYCSPAPVLRCNAASSPDDRAQQTPQANPVQASNPYSLSALAKAWWNKRWNEPIKQDRSFYALAKDCIPPLVAATCFRHAWLGVAGANRGIQGLDRLVMPAVSASVGLACTLLTVRNLVHCSRRADNALWNIPSGSVACLKAMPGCLSATCGRRSNS
jgi:hypothetical protein